MLFWICILLAGPVFVLGLLVVLALRSLVQHPAALAWPHHEDRRRRRGEEGQARPPHTSQQGVSRMLCILLIILGALGVLVALYARAAGVELERSRGACPGPRSGAETIREAVQERDGEYTP